MSAKPESFFSKWERVIKATPRSKCKSCHRKIKPHDMQCTYPDLCEKCADQMAQHMNDIRP